MGGGGGNDAGMEELLRLSKMPLPQVDEAASRERPPRDGGHDEGAISPRGRLSSSLSDDTRRLETLRSRGVVKIGGRGSSGSYSAPKPDSLIPIPLLDVTAEAKWSVLTSVLMRAGWVFSFLSPPARLISAIGPSENAAMAAEDGSG